MLIRLMRMLTNWVLEACADWNNAAAWLKLGRVKPSSDPWAAKLCTVHTEVNTESDVYAVALNTLLVKHVI